MKLKKIQLFRFDLNDFFFQLVHKKNKNRYLNKNSRTSIYARLGYLVVNHECTFSITK